MRAREAAAKQIGALSIQGDQLRKDTAEANSRTAEAELKLEQVKKEVREEQEKSEREYRSKFSRFVYPAHQMMFQQRFVSSPKGPITVVWDKSDEEAARFGATVLQILSTNGFEAKQGDDPMPFSEPGQWIVVKRNDLLNAAYVIAIRSAFLAVKQIDFALKSQADILPTSGDVVVVIGQMVIPPRK